MLTEHEWKDVLPSFADATYYQTWAYAAARCGERNVARMALRQDGRVIALAQARIYKPPILSCGVAYVHWGPLWRKSGEPSDPVVLEAALAALRTEFVQRRQLVLRVLPPHYERTGESTAQSSFTAAGFKPLAANSRLLLVDIRPSLEDLRKGLDKKWRNQLAAAEKAGLTIVEDTSSEVMAAFGSIYREMLLRKGLRSDAGFGQMCRGGAGDNVPANLAPRVVLATLDGRPLAGAIISALGKTGIYMFGATTTEGMHLKASNLVQWHGVGMLKRLGVEYYDLSGINPVKNPGTYHFKRGLCGKNGGEARMTHFVCSRGLSQGIVQFGLRLRTTLQSWTS